MQEIRRTAHKTLPPSWPQPEDVSSKLQAHILKLSLGLSSWMVVVGGIVFPKRYAGDTMNVVLFRNKVSADVNNASP